MRFLQPSLSSAASRASSHISSNPRRSSRMVSGQFFLGFPLPLFRPGVHAVLHLFGFSIHVHSEHITMSTSNKIIYLESGKNQDEDLLQQHPGNSKKLKIFAWQV